MLGKSKLLQKNDERYLWLIGMQKKRKHNKTKIIKKKNTTRKKNQKEKTKNIKDKVNNENKRARERERHSHTTQTMKREHLIK